MGNSYKLYCENDLELQRQVTVHGGLRWDSKNFSFPRIFFFPTLLLQINKNIRKAINLHYSRLTCAASHWNACETVQQPHPKWR